MSDTLFNFDEDKPQKEVTCLGMVFKNEDERKEFFRNELRKKLPALKKIDGFPIGEDEDIIALSDPPFYTACPNPWLNDFIEEWEKDKSKTPNRVDNFVVDEPFASDVSEGKNNPIYNAHSYHTKVPHPAIMRYILHYTQPGDIIFDGFAGTGMTGVAAQMCGNPDLETKTKIEKEWEEQGRGKPVWGPRKAILGDLSPIASFIAYNYNTPVDIDKFKAEAERILKEVEDELGWMYYTLQEGQEHKQDIIDKVIEQLPNCKTPKEAKALLDGSGLLFGKINYTVWSDVFICPECMGEIVFYDVAVDHVDGSVRDEFNCPHCNSIRTKSNSEKMWETTFDNSTGGIVRKRKSVPIKINYSILDNRFYKRLDVLDEIILYKLKHFGDLNWFPKDRIIDGDEIGRLKNLNITKVNQLLPIRATLFCSKFITRGKYSSKFQILITSALLNLTWMYRWRLNGKGGTTSGTYYICATPQENNPAQQIGRKIKDFCQAFQLIARQHNLVFVGSSHQLFIQAETVDYIFTDPPFGANIMYSELNFLWESWLK
jgi:hypothetical protein